MLSDLDNIASWVLRTAPASLFTEHGPGTLAAWQHWREQPPAARNQPRRGPPASARLTAALAVTSMSILAGDDTRAIGRIGALLPPGASSWQPRLAGLPAPHWKQLSPQPDPDWLREQYLTRQRPYADIAAELGIHIMTVIAAAAKSAPGHPACTASRDDHQPPRRHPRRRSQRRRSRPAGWHRLRRFQAAMTFPTIEAAATHLGAHQYALIHQFRRLERDIGAPLYHPSTPRQPMHPTQRGTALLAALAQPDIHAAATANAPDVSGPGPRNLLRPGRRSREREADRTAGPAACPANSANPSSQTSTPERQPRCAPKRC